MKNTYKLAKIIVILCIAVYVIILMYVEVIRISKYDKEYRDLQKQKIKLEIELLTPKHK